MRLLFGTAVIQAVVMSRKSVGDDWLKYSLHVVNRYKFPADRREPLSSATPPLPLPPLSSSSSSSSSSARPAAAEAGSEVTRRRRLGNAWAHVADAACGCPRLAVRATYLLAGSTTHSGGVGGGAIGEGDGSGLVLGRDSVVMPWTASLSRRLKRIARYHQRRGC